MMRAMRKAPRISHTRGHCPAGLLGGDSITPERAEARPVPTERPYYKAYDSMRNYFDTRWPLIVAYLLFAALLLQTLIICAPQPLLLLLGILAEALGYRVLRRYLLHRLGLVEVPARGFMPDRLGPVIDRLWPSAATGPTVPLFANGESPAEEKP